MIGRSSRTAGRPMGTLIYETAFIDPVQVQELLKVRNEQDISDALTNVNIMRGKRAEKEFDDSRIW